MKKREKVLQKIINYVVDKGYYADLKQIGLFIARKIDKLIMQSK